MFFAPLLARHFDKFLTNVIIFRHFLSIEAKRKKILVSFYFILRTQILNVVNFKSK
jgi:hypothetical protein